MGAAGAGHAAVRADLGVVLNEPDLVGGDAQRFEGFQRDHQGADVAALSEFLIGVVLCDGAVRIKLKSRSGFVGLAFGDVEAAPGHADAAAFGRRVFGFGVLDRFFINRLEDLHHIFHRVLTEGVAVDVRVARAADVAPAELERIDTGLLCEHVHEVFAERVGLRRTVAAIGGAEVVVRVRYAAEAGHVGNVVREEREAGLLCKAVVAAPGVGAVVESEVKLGGRDLAVLIAGESAVGVAGAAFAGEMLVFFIAHGERHRALHYDCGSARQAEVASVGRPAEAGAGRVHDDTHLVDRMADGVADAADRGIDALGLALERQIIVFVKVGFDRIALDGEVRLARRVETAFHAVSGLVDDLRDLGGLFEAFALEHRLQRENVRRIFMDALCIRHSRFEEAHVFRQLLDLDLHLGSGGAGMALGVGRHESDAVAIAVDDMLVEYFTARDPDRAARVEVCFRHLVGAAGRFNILRQDDLGYAGHLLCFGSVDAEDLRMARKTRLHDYHVPDVLRHLEFLVVAVIGEAADLGESGRTHERFAIVFLVLRHLDLDVVDRGFAAHDSGGVHDGVDDLLVARAAADVLMLLEPVADLFARRIIVLGEQCVGGDDKARRAETALDGAVVHESHLNGMQMLRRADAFNRSDRAEFLNAAHFVDAGAHELAVEYYGAGTADADAAADLDAGAAKSSEYVGQRFLNGVAHEHPVDAVDVQPHFSESHYYSPSSWIFSCNLLSIICMF